MSNKSMKKLLSFENRDSYVDLGEHIAFYRKCAHLTQEELSRRIGVTRTYLNRIESPNIVQSFSLEVLFNISRELNISPAHFFEPYSKNIPKEKD